MHHIDRLFNSIFYKQALEIEYRTYNNVLHIWTIHPYLIKQFNNRWFLLGKNTSKKGVISNLPLDRIESISDSGIPYEEDDGIMKQKLDNIVGVTINWNAGVENVNCNSQKIDFHTSLPNLFMIVKLLSTKKTNSSN